MTRRATRPLLVAALLAVALLAGCGGEQAPAADAATPVASTTPLPGAEPLTPTATPTQAPAAVSPGSYLDYAEYTGNEATYASGTVVLFFHASWCPSCQQTEENLLADLSGIPAGLTIVKVDYDTATDLKRQYGITQQHTFVSVDADGAALAKFTGTYTAAEIAESAGA